jgi:hypothetical protein
MKMHLIAPKLFFRYCTMSLQRFIMPRRLLLTVTLNQNIYMIFDALLLVFNFLESWTNFIQLSMEGLTNMYDFGILELSILASVTCQVSDNIYDKMFATMNKH